MTIAEWRQKTVEGGFTEQKNSMGFAMSLHELLLCPSAWQAVGKVEGWKYKVYKNGAWHTENEDLSIKSDTPFRFPEWQYKMHRMIDALAEGKSIEEYLETL